MRPLSPFKSSVNTLTSSASQSEAFVASPGKQKSRAIHVDVLIEGVEAETSYELPAAARTFLAWLGEVLQPSSARATESTPPTPGRKETNPVALKNTLTELLTTERSYVRRIRTLHSAYAVPLRASARNSGRNAMSITTYEANILFGNIEKILAVNEAFLRDLEDTIKRNDSSWADVILHHISAFECYNVYVTNYPTAKDIERRLASNTTFTRFCENVQYSPAADVGSAGLRDLLAEPFQRIARYPLMLNEMLRQLSSDDPLRPALSQASAAAADIAHNEHDEVARRTEEMIALTSNIADVPRTLVNGQRRFLAMIDVKDMPSGSSTALHATLMLFNDVLVITKRPSGEKGRSLAGLERAGNSALLRSPLKGGILSGGLQYKGCVKLLDLTAVDDGASFALHFDVPPQEVGSKWSGRPTRRCFAETSEKRAFVAQLWKAQAQLRAHPGISTVFATTTTQLAQAAALPVEQDDAHVYFTVYNRAAYQDEPDKGHTVLRLEGSGGSYEPLTFPVDALKPQMMIDAVHTGTQGWKVAIRKRGQQTQELKRLLRDAELAYNTAQSVLQSGLVNVPPRYAMHYPSAEMTLPGSPSKHRRTRSDAGKASNVMNWLRESTASAAFGEVSVRPDKPDDQQENEAVEVLATSMPSSGNNHAGSRDPAPEGQSCEAQPEDDVFGPVATSPRAKTPLGPRPSPSQRRKPVPHVDEDLQSLAEGIDGSYASSNLKRQREEAEAPGTPSSTHVRKRATTALTPQRYSATADYSPGVRSPLGRHPPRHADRDSSTAGLLKDIDAAIEDAASRSGSMVNLRQVVNTFVLPPQDQVPTPKSIVDRSGATGLSRRGSIPRSPKLDHIAPAVEARHAEEPTISTFKAEVNDKLDALLGGWEETTQQYRRLAETYKTEKASFTEQLASRDTTICQLKGKVVVLENGHSQLNDEVQEIYAAVNKELDRIYEGACLSGDEATVALQRELKSKTANEVLLRYRIRQLEIQLMTRT